MTLKRVAVIGCGNLGTAIINGLIEHGEDPARIVATRRDLSKLTHLSQKGVHCTTDNISAIQQAEIIILALKPYTISKIVATIASSIHSEKQIVVSLATGVSIADLEDILGSEKQLFRAMPNTAAEVGESMTCIATNSSNTEIIQRVESCFNTIGSTVTIDESLMDAATVIGACGIAYVLRFMRSMTQGGIQIGFDAQTANQIVTQTVKGAATLLSKNGNHPESEIDKVTTPKGCTIAGLNEMEHNGFSSALIKGITKSYEEIS